MWLRVYLRQEEGHKQNLMNALCEGGSDEEKIVCKTFPIKIKKLFFLYGYL